MGGCRCPPRLVSHASFPRPSLPLVSLNALNSEERVSGGVSSKLVECHRYRHTNAMSCCAPWPKPVRTPPSSILPPRTTILLRPLPPHSPPPHTLFQALPLAHLAATVAGFDASLRGVAGALAYALGNNSRIGGLSARKEAITAVQLGV